MGAFAPGQTVEGLAGTYVVEGTHGEGGFGVTYRAWHAQAGQTVLLKELRIERLKSWKALELFEREAETLRGVRHANIPEYYDFFAYGGGVAAPASALSSLEAPGPVTLVLVQQFIAGQSLQQAIDAGFRWTNAQVEAFLRQMLAVLSYLHELNPPVVHRDISPKNIIVTPEGRPYLVDFGAIQDRIRTASSIASTSVGTMGFMPLEQLMGAARPASDLYALAMSVISVVSGRPPTELPTDDRTGKLRLGPVLRGLPPPIYLALDGMAEPIVGNRIQSARAALAVLDGKAAPPRGRLLRAAVGVTAALTLAAGASAGLAVAHRAAPVSPPPAAPATAAPAPAASPPGPTDAADATPPPGPEESAAPASPEPAPAAPAQAATLVWNGDVASVHGRGPPRGAACSLRAEVSRRGEQIAVLGVQLTCGTKKLYDSSDELNGMSSLSYAVAEAPAPRRPGWLRYTLRYLDQGARTGERAQIALDTRAHEATVVDEAPPASRILVRLEEFSTAREGSRLTPTRGSPFEGAIERSAVVTGIRGPAPVKPGDACLLRIEPDELGPHNCRARISCGDAVLYGDGEGGYNDCTLRAGKPVGFLDKAVSGVDGDARAGGDLISGHASISDRKPEGRYRVELSLR
jgi:serine/threonine protein kinase